MNAINLKPTAKIAVQKSVLRVYKVDNQSTVYLKDGTEFQIELFNPLQETILCKFKCNGKSLNGEGLILYPGQRVFLERYLDNNSKLKFETYKVEDTAEVNNAITKNGLIEVEFFHEKIVQSAPYYTNITIYNPYIYPRATYQDICYGNNINNFCTTPTLTSRAIPDWMDVPCSSNLDLKEKETGIISKGNNSDQKFSYLDMNFESLPFNKVSIKILPESEKIYDDKDFKHRKYCSECGKKVNQNDKFCSHCGTKL